MICFHVNGGLGNQMFIYAFAQEMKRQRKTYCLSRIGKLNYFTLNPGERWLNLFKFIFFKILEKIFRLGNHHHLKDQTKIHYEFVNRLKGLTVLDGYFQSEDYFREAADQVRRNFSLTRQSVLKFEKVIGTEFRNKKVLAIHIRRTDYHNAFQNLGIGTGSFALPVSYYQNALRLIQDLHSYQVIFISDDIEFAKANFPELKQAIFSNHEEIVDLQILMNADALILANSSFSWWGAWLNHKPTKKIFVPKYYLGYKIQKTFPANIIPAGWTEVAVSE
jgi:hypothetical protein